MPNYLHNASKILIAVYTIAYQVSLCIRILRLLIPDHTFPSVVLGSTI